MPFFSSFTGSFTGGRRKPISIGGGGGGGGEPGPGFAWTTSLPATYDNASISNDFPINQVDGTGDNVYDLYMHPDGTKMYTRTWIGNDYVHQWDLSTPNDVSTATYSGTKYDFATPLTADGQTNPTYAKKLTFKPDGTKMYLLSSRDGSIFEFTLSTAWDITTASFTFRTILTLTGASSVGSVQFNNDGTKLYVPTHSSFRTIYEYDLSTAYDLSSITTTASTTFDYSTIAQLVADNSGYDIESSRIAWDGSYMYFVDDEEDVVHELEFGTAWDLSTLTYSTSSSVADMQRPAYVSFSADSTKMYIMTAVDDEIHQYTMS